MRTLLLLVVVVASQLPAAITVKHDNPAIPDTLYTESQLQNAIDATTTVCGDIIEIDPGASRHGVTYYLLRGPALSPSLGGPAVPPSYAKDCSPSGKYITIRSSKAYQLTPGKRVGAADAANLAFIGLASSSCVVMSAERAASYYRLQGLEIAATPISCGNLGGNNIVRITTTAPPFGGSNVVWPELYPNHIMIDQCWIHGLDGFAQADGVQLSGISNQLINSTVENIRTFAGQKESHAITSVDGGYALRVINNKLSAGELTVLWGGATAPIQWSRAENIEFANNWIYRPYKWLDWNGTTDPTPLSPCPLDYDGHGATYRNTSAVTYWECQGPIWDASDDTARSSGTWTRLADLTAYNTLINARIPTGNKNIFEIKDGSRVHLEGNVLDQAYSWAVQQQTGVCFLFNMVTGGPTNSAGGPLGASEQASHVLVENNICRHAPRGIENGTNFPTGGIADFWANFGRPTFDVVFRNNAFLHMAEDMYTNAAFGTLSGWSGVGGFVNIGNANREGMTIDHATYQSDYTRGTVGQTAGTIGNYPGGFNPAKPALNQRIINSIWTAGKVPYQNGDYNTTNNQAVMSSWGTYAEMSSNAIIDYLGITLAGMTPLTQHCTPGLVPTQVTTTVPCAYSSPKTAFPPSCIGCQYPVPSAAGFTSYPNDLTLQPGSRLIAAGLDGKDIGADLNTVAWATAGAQAGTMAPYLAMKIRGVVPSATSVDVRFSAIDTSSCAIEARVYGFPLSTPVATATDNAATLDRLVTLTGLSSGQKYALKVTCAGLYYREDEFLTP